MAKKKVWKFVHHKDYVTYSDVIKGRKFDSEWLQIQEEGKIIVKASKGRGYAWDGCTPKRNILHLTFGTPDGKIYRFGYNDYKPYAYYASMIHDIIYQYKAEVPITRKEADVIFCDMLKSTGFLWYEVYYLGVRLLGGIFGKWKYKRTRDLIIAK